MRFAAAVTPYLMTSSDGRQPHVVAGAPHGCDVSHPEELNRVLLDSLAR